MSRITLFYRINSQVERELSRYQRMLGNRGYSYRHVLELIRLAGYPCMDNFLSLVAAKRFAEISIYQLAVWRQVCRTIIKDADAGNYEPGTLDFPRQDF